MGDAAQTTRAHPAFARACRDFGEDPTGSARTHAHSRLLLGGIAGVAILHGPVALAIRLSSCRLYSGLRGAAFSLIDRCCCALGLGKFLGGNKEKRKKDD